MLGAAFLVTFFMSFDAMVASFIPGVIAFLGSALGIFICACRMVEKPLEK